MVATNRINSINHLSLKIIKYNLKPQQNSILTEVLLHYKILKD